jgi:hypothetical protein
MDLHLLRAWPGSVESSSKLLRAFQRFVHFAGEEVLPVPFMAPPFPTRRDQSRP